MREDPKPWLRVPPDVEVGKGLRGLRSERPPAGAALRVRALVLTRTARRSGPGYGLRLAAELTAVAVASGALAFGLSPLRSSVWNRPSPASRAAIPPDEIARSMAAPQEVTFAEPTSGAPAPIPLAASPEPSHAIQNESRPASQRLKSRAVAGHVVLTSAKTPLQPARSSQREPSGNPPQAAVGTTSVSPPTNDSLAAETFSLRQAVEALHTRRDPQAAIALLDSYDASFAKGKLRSDARLLRIDALLSLRHPEQALELLGPEAILELPRADELQLLRGELLLQLGRAHEALACFESALQTPVPRLMKRAEADRSAAQRVLDE